MLYMRACALICAGALLTTFHSQLLSRDNRTQELRSSNPGQPPGFSSGSKTNPQSPLTPPQHVQWQVPTNSLFTITTAHYEVFQLSTFLFLWYAWHLEPSDLECWPHFPMGKPRSVLGSERLREDDKNKCIYVWYLLQSCVVVYTYQETQHVFYYLFQDFS